VRYKYYYRLGRQSISCLNELFFFLSAITILNIKIQKTVILHVIGIILKGGFSHHEKNKDSRYLGTVKYAEYLDLTEDDRRTKESPQ